MVPEPAGTVSKVTGSKLGERSEGGGMHDVSVGSSSSSRRTRSPMIRPPCPCKRSSASKPSSIQRALEDHSHPQLSMLRSTNFTPCRCCARPRSLLLGSLSIVRRPLISSNERLNSSRSLFSMRRSTRQRIRRNSAHRSCSSLICPDAPLKSWSSCCKLRSARTVGGRAVFLEIYCSFAAVVNERYALAALIDFMKSRQGA